MTAGELALRVQAKPAPGGRWMARCPAHGDDRESLQIATGQDGRVLLKCFAGCPLEAILEAAGMTTPDLFPPRDAGRQIVDTYDYTDQKGRLCYQVVRYRPKDFRQRRLDGQGTWVWNLQGMDRVLYRLPAVLEAAQHGQVIFVVEGEKDADAVTALGMVATTNAGGAKKWTRAYTETLRGADVVLIPDNDTPGRQHMETVAQALYGIAKRVKLLTLEGVPPKGDVSDWLVCGHTRTDLEQLVAQTPEWVPSAVDAPSAPDKPTDLHFTDLGNAERLVRRHGDDSRYCPTWGQWLIWNGQRWVPDTTGEILRRAKDTIRSLYAEAAALEDDDKRTALARWAMRSESEGKLRAMVSLAESELPITPDALDTDPWLLNCENGTLDLRTGTLRPSRREEYLTKLLPVAYDPQATCPTWIAFLKTITGENPALQAFLQRAVGYSLTGQTTEQAFFLLYGTGANGKSTFIETLRTLLGDYAKQADFGTFLARPTGGAREDVARLAGARFVAATEAESDQRFSEVLLKQLTGGDAVTARFLYQEGFEFRPMLKLWLAANTKPTIKGSDHGIWRRIRLIPFTVTILPEQQDRHLADKLRAELPGILAWAVHGCLAWQTDGLGTPPEVDTATESYKADMDPLVGFLDDCCTLHANGETPAADLYDTYRQWSEANGEYCLRQRSFGQRLREHGLDNRKAHGRKVWVGISLLGSASSPYLGEHGDHGGRCGAKSKEKYGIRGQVTETSSPIVPKVPWNAALESLLFEQAAVCTQTYEGQGIGRWATQCAPELAQAWDTQLATLKQAREAQDLEALRLAVQHLEALVFHGSTQMTEQSA